MVDEMGTKRQTDCDSKEVVGYCDLGHGIIRNNCVTFAKHALVFLAVAVNQNWKIPLGYALIDVWTATLAPTWYGSTSSN